MRRYIQECLAGGTGPRGRDFNMRWIASLVEEMYRILTRGGVFLYPKDSKEAGVWRRAAGHAEPIQTEMNFGLQAR